MTCANCKDAPYPWNCGTCHPVPPKPEKIEVNMEFIEEVATQGGGYRRCVLCSADDYAGVMTHDANCPTHEISTQEELLLAWERYKREVLEI